MSNEPKRGVGRPTKYNPELQAEADTYVYRLEELGHVVPSRAGLCCFLGISRETSYQWEKEHRQFSDTLQSVDVLQEHLALNGGLAGGLNSTIVKLVLANHGYSDKQAIDHTTAGESLRSIDPAKLSTTALEELIRARTETDK